MGSFCITLILHQFFRCTQHRWFVPQVSTHILDPGTHLRVRDVSAIPSQKVFDSMNRSDRDMERVNVGSIRNAPVGDKRTG
jgi:hypothetical protein